MERGKGRSKHLFCLLTGGHKYKPWECKFEHVIDGLYSVTSKCCKCGHIRQDTISITVPEWEERIKEVRKYDGK